MSQSMRAQVLIGSTRYRLNDVTSRRKRSCGGTLMTSLDTGAAAAFGALQAHFETTDALRRLQGSAMASFGLGSRESPYVVTASGAYWPPSRLRKCRCGPFNSCRRSANQASLHLGSRVFHERDTLLSRAEAARAPARMASSFDVDRRCGPRRVHGGDLVLHQAGDPRG